MQASKPHNHPNIHLYEVANTKGHKHKKHLLLVESPGRALKSKAAGVTPVLVTACWCSG